MNVYLGFASRALAWLHCTTKNTIMVADISIVSLQGYTAAQLATEPVQEFLREGPLTGGTDVDIQLLEAAKTGDLDLVKVKINNCVYDGACVSTLSRSTLSGFIAILTERDVLAFAMISLSKFWRRTQSYMVG